MSYHLSTCEKEILVRCSVNEVMKTSHVITFRIGLVPRFFLVYVGLVFPFHYNGNKRL